MDEFLKRPKFYFTLVGVWPIAKSKWSWLYYLYSVLSTYFISYLFMLSLIIDIYLHLDNIDIVTEASYVLMTQLTFVIKFMCFTFRRPKFIKLLQVVRSPVYESYTLAQKKYITKWSSFANMYTKTYYSSAAMSGVIFVVNALVFADEMTTPLPMRGWFPFDIKHSPLNWTIAFCFQIIALAILVTTNIHLDCTACILMNIICAQVQVLKDSLENLVSNAEKYFIGDDVHADSSMHWKLRKESDENFVEMVDQVVDDKVEEILKKCAYHHNEIIRLLFHIQQVFSLAMASQFFAVVVTLCVTGFQLAVIPLTGMQYVTVISYLANVIFEILLYCWNGDQIIHQSSDINYNCYKAEWYKCSTKVKRSLFIIMERAKYPLQIYAGQFFIVSIDTFVGILRSSYSYFAVLRNVYED